jgi:hypothetical protein
MKTFFLAGAINASVISAKTIKLFFITSIFCYTNLLKIKRYKTGFLLNFTYLKYLNNFAV